MRFRDSILCALCLLSSLVGRAQVELRGRVLADASGEAIAFASVVLTSERDSTLVLRGITDLQGGYAFSPVQVGRYRLSIQCLGYSALQRPIRVVLPSSGRIVEVVDRMSEDVRALDDVVVEGVASRQAIDHRSFRFGDAAVKGALHSYDLLKTLPVVQVDVMEDRLKGLMGGAVQLLINGVRATPSDVRLVPKEKIKRVEVYDIPPARYRHVECVINIITANPEDGYQLGGSLHHALATGFGDDNLYASLVRGRHKVGLEYALNYRDYRLREMHSTYRYALAGQDARYTYTDHERFGYTTHSPVLKYAYVQEGRSLWEARLRPSFERRFSDKAGMGSYLLDGAEHQRLTTQGYNRIQQFNPSIDLYHWRKIGDKDELSVNAVGTAFSTKRQTAHREDDEATQLLNYEDFMDLANKKQSLILELAHQRATSSLRWSSGYRGELSYLHSRVTNYFGAIDYSSRSLVHYAYSEVSGKYQRLLYRVSLGLTHSTNISSYRSYRHLAFTPKVMLGYTLGRRSALRVMYDEFPVFPDLPKLSSNRERESKDIVSMGNPLLENEMVRKITAMYSYRGRVVDLSLVGAYIHTRAPHVSISVLEGERYLLRPINGDYDRTIGGGIKLRVSPLGGDVLRLDALLLPMYSQLRAHGLSYTHRSCHTELSASLQWRGVDMYYKLVLPSYGARGGYASRTEAEHTLYMAYKLKRWRVFASMLFIGQPAHYHTYTLGAPLVYSSRASWIHDNKNMLTLGVAYHFSVGKDKEYTKSLNNQDTAAPTI